MAKSRAEQEFKQRGRHDVGTDGSHFRGWYHDEDAARILWARFRTIDPALTTETMPPFVFPHGLDRFALPVYLTPLMEALRRTVGKKYYPFLFKPEAGNLHYIAGFLRKNERTQALSLFLFNPLGCLAHIDFGSFKNNKKIIEIFSSPHKVQTERKDEGHLASCGPLAVAFIEHLLRNPNYMATLDKKFILPKHFNRFLGGKSDYKREVMALRSEHRRVLAGLSDRDLPQADESNIEMTLDVSWAMQQERSSKRQKREPGDSISFFSRIPLPKSVSPKLKNERVDVAFVQAQIARYQKNASKPFSIGDKKKAVRLKAALNRALRNELKDVRVDEGVLKVLKKHRMFPFFGGKKTKAMKQLEESLHNFPILS